MAFARSVRTFLVSLRNSDSSICSHTSVSRSTKSRLCSGRVATAAAAVFQQRHIHRSVVFNSSKSYEPDGKTTVTILNDESGAPLMIDSYSKHGFRLNNGMSVIGPMCIFPRTVLGWDVGGIRDVTPESLALFSVLVPKPDVLVIGIGDQGSKLPLETVQFLRQKKINMEILATEHACTTFNFLSGEGRCAAAVMIPPSRIIWTGEDLANMKRQKKELYEDEPDEISPPDKKK